MPKIERALLSVSDKTGIVELARELAALGIEIVSTGGTARELEAAGIPVVQIGAYTGSPEILDGRVKTLHPKIHAGILARRDRSEHLQQLRSLGIGRIDLVVVNLYPFEATVARSDCTWEEAIENIDIGGPSMIRAAAKNHEGVTVVVDPRDYLVVLEELRSRGEVSLSTNRRLAQKAFALTARYDGAIAMFLGSRTNGERQPFSSTFHLTLPKAQELRYGENPHQRAALYGHFLDCVEQLHGKELSYNNIVDIHSAVGLMIEFIDHPQSCVAIFKHNTPCGVGCGPDDVVAYRRAFATDPESPFGGILISNRTWSMELAREVDEIFTEVLIAPDFAADALEFLRRKKNRRLMRWRVEATPIEEWDVRGVFGGLLVQERDRAMEDPRAGRVVTRRTPTDAEYAAMAFGLKVVKHVKSNAIVFCHADATLAIGGGATSRVDPVYAARAKAQRVGVDLRGSVLASDAFFPFPDGVEVAAEAGVSAIVQPGGSVRDEEVITAADRLGLAMVFTGVRHFRH